MSSALDQEFETGVRLIRDAYSKKKEAEVVHLRGDNARKDAEVKELQIKITQLESQLLRAEKRIGDLTRMASKLSHFKQSVLDSFEEDDYDEVKRKLGEKTSRAMTPNISVFGDYNNNRTKFVDLPDAPTANNNNNELNDLASSYPNYNSAINKDYTTYTSILKESLQRDGNAFNKDFASSKHSVAQKLQSQDEEHNSNNNAATTQQQHQKQEASERQSNTVDGRDYFKKAKSVLTYDEFTALLWNVKAYNNREQSRLKTLENVYGILGIKYKGLYDEFEKLLSH